MHRTTAALSVLALAPPAFADVALHALFTDHVVLQRDSHVPVWGTADPGEEVTVTIGRQHLVTKADKNGRFRVELAPMPAGGPHELTVRGKNEVKVRDLLFGEVWLCSGQSNMEWRVRQAKDPQQEAAAADHPRIRLFKVPRRASPEHHDDAGAKWEICSPRTVPDFSAVGYYFGRSLHQNLEHGGEAVPIGLVQSAWGGTRVEAWTSAATLQRTAAAGPVLDRWDEIVRGHPAAMKRHQENMAKWREAAAKAGERVPRRPRAPLGPKSQHRPANLYNGMIAPLVPFAIRGAIWYQGESNATRAYQYRELFKALIRDWRRQWDRGDFPFLFVQLANWKVRGRQDPKTWAELREAQTMALDLPHTGMAVTIDIGNPNDIHPKNKQEVGRRLALVARSRVFGQDVVYSGPMYRSMEVKDDEVVLRFRHAGGGLVAKSRPRQADKDGNKSDTHDVDLAAGRLAGFMIAGKDRKFFRAKARIEGDTVIVSRPDRVEAPVAVRYAWLDDPACNLFNREGLPASPFRTDDWPGVTVGNQRP